MRNASVTHTHTLNSPIRSCANERLSPSTLLELDSDEEESEAESEAESDAESESEAESDAESEAESDAESDSEEEEEEEAAAASAAGSAAGSVSGSAAISSTARRTDMDTGCKDMYCHLKCNLICGETNLFILPPVDMQAASTEKRMRRVKVFIFSSFVARLFLRTSLSVSCLSWVLPSFFSVVSPSTFILL